MTSVREDVVAVFAEVAEVDPDLVREDMRFEALGLDSVQSATAMARIEDALGVEIGERDALELQTVGAVVAYLVQRV